MKDSIKRLRNLANNLSVLIVEDEELINTQLCEYLEKFFKVVKSAVNGKEGLEYYEKEHFDIVISDIVMPEMSGIEMLQKIKEKNTNQKVIIASAYTNSNYFIEAIDMGVNHYILKPINYKHLLEVLYDVCKEITIENENSMYKNHLEEMVVEKTNELRNQFWNDTLTGLPNRFKLSSDMKKNNINYLAVFNIDNFSKYNATFGYKIGDKVIKLVGDRLGSKLDAEMSLYRIDADEYVVVSKIKNQDEIYKWIEDILQDIKSRPISLDSLNFDITFTIGIAQCTDAMSFEHARSAIGSTREVGKGRIAFYDKNIDYESRKIKLLHKISEIEPAIQGNLFEPFFQPIIDNKTKEIVKYECLARLKMPDGRYASPGEFLSAVEESGFLPQMSEQIIKKSFEKMSKYSYDFSINITGRELLDSNFVDFISKNISRYNIDPNRVVIEILEGVSFKYGTEITETLNSICSLGCRLSIDDFGTEGSNFSRLMDLNVDYIKIDGSFIKDIDTNARSRKVTGAIVAFAKSIGCKTIAEYVHSEEIWNEVKEMGIDFSQGYWISEAVKEIDNE